MPQLVPFFFINQAVIVFFILIVLTYVYSKHILPVLVALFFTRLRLPR